MAYAGGAAAGGAAAAAAQRRREEEEEEHMTNYAPEDLNEDWEFKIVRSSFNKFRNSEQLKQMLKEESQAGWSLVEKFDNGRVRLKRPASASRNDHLLPREVDPYRTTYGGGEAALVLLILGVTGAALFAIILLAAILG
jgi:hypothetical protein